MHFQKNMEGKKGPGVCGHILQGDNIIDHAQIPYPIPEIGKSGCI